MNNDTPPPPPPHGEAPKSSGLPPGNYDIFIIPPHSAGSGFIYLPSLKPNVNSFAAGFATALILVALGSMLAPAFQAWWAGVKVAGGMGTMLLMLAIGVGAWALGRTQTDGGPGPGGGGGGGGGPRPGAGAGAHPNGNGYANGTAPGAGAGTHPNGNGYASGAAPGPQPGPQTGHQAGHQAGQGPTPGTGYAGGEMPRSSWQRPTPSASANSQPKGDGGTNARPNTTPNATPKPAPNPKPNTTPNPKPKPTPNTTTNTTPNPTPNTTPNPKPNPTPNTTPNNAAKGAWEKAREETKKREEERKAKEAEKKRKEDLEKRLKEMREKDAREREAREKLAKEKAEREALEAKLRAAKAAEDSRPKGSTYAFSAVGEKTNPWPRGQPPSPAARSQSSSPTKKPPPPTAKTYLGTEEDAYSFRPYDKPKNPMHHKKAPSSLYSESSYAASHSTSRTTPPPSSRGPYSTKDPDKIVIKAVYAFNNAFLSTPSSQLLSGVGPVTDGLILRITTEGLFIDDDVRGVPQREWDVKAWSMKLIEVWCPSLAGTSARVAAASSSASPLKSKPMHRIWGLDKNKEKVPSSAESDALLVEMLQLCKDNCRFRASSAARLSVATSSVYSASSAGGSVDERFSESSFASSSYASSYASSPSEAGSSSKERRTDNRGAHQTGELKSARLHVLRASLRDQDGKRFVFVVTEEESWKIAVGLQRLRKGSLVRAFGVSGMSANDARTTLESLGWG